MADEITYSVALQASKGNVDIKREYLRKTVDMTGDAYSATVQSIPTTAEGTLIVIAAAVASAGYAVFINQDATNFVQIGPRVGATLAPAIKLRAGEACLVPLATTTLYAMADTAAVLLESFILEV